METAGSKGAKFAGRVRSFGHGQWASCSRVDRLLPYRLWPPAPRASDRRTSFALPERPCSTCATVRLMSRSITQRELRNASGEIMRGLDRGESFLVTRNGVPVGELTPVKSRQFVATGAAIATFASAPAVDPDRFRSDLDAAVDQDTAPRA